MSHIGLIARHSTLTDTSVPGHVSIIRVCSTLDDQNNISTIVQDEFRYCRL